MRETGVETVLIKRKGFILILLFYPFNLYRYFILGSNSTHMYTLWVELDPHLYIQIFSYFGLSLGRDQHRLGRGCISESRLDPSLKNLPKYIKLDPNVNNSTQNSTTCEKLDPHVQNSTQMLKTRPKLDPSVKYRPDSTHM